MRKSQAHITTLVLAAAAIAAATLGASTTRANDTAGYATVSLSGSTAMRNFTTAAGSTWLTPGQTFTISGTALSNSTTGAATYSTTPFTVTAPNSNSVTFQLAPGTYETPVTTANSADVLRVEWHEQGSVEGIQDLIASQIGTGVNWTATAGNPIWVNGNKFAAPGTINGWNLTQQNAVQMAVSDVNHVQGFSIAGTPSVGATPTSPGYGKGNPALSANLTTSGDLVNGLTQAGIRAALVDQSALNMPATQFGTGAWNTGGLANAQSTKVAVTATLFTANPGTGLTQLDRTDAQWLQTASRLQNGATFNFTSRDVNSGTRNVAALNTGIDPSWAVGKNDAGNGYLSNATTTQINLNPNGITFSNKSAGGGQLRPTLQLNRMSVGTLGLSDAIGSVTSTGANGANPLRSLAYSNSTDGSSPYVQVSLANITNGNYVIWQNETYVTLKNPTGFNPANGTWASQTDAQTGILGDTVGAVAQYRQNVLFGAFNEQTLGGINNPGDTLLAQSFIPEQYMQVSKNVDGIGTTSANTQFVGNATLNTLLNFAPYVANFAATNTATAGTGQIYGKYSGSTYVTPAQGDIAITSSNFLFGNFNQNGTRDLSSVESALAALKAYNALTGGAGQFYNTGANNSSNITYTAVNGSNITISKGDAIVMGDTLSRGTFNGMDLYNLAHGAALSDASGTGFANGTLTSASGADLNAQIHNGTLRKNTALDYLQANTTPGDPIRVSASQNIVNDPTGINAFNKFDVNHDGLVNRSDASVVDSLLGMDYTNLTQQLGVSLKDANGNQQSIVDAVLADGHTTVLRSDLDLITGNLMASGGLTLGDSNFDGKVDLTDLSTVLNNFGSTTAHWSAGNFDGAATIDLTDLSDVLNNFGSTAASVTSTTVAATPEPASLALLSVAGLLLLKRRR